MEKQPSIKNPMAQKTVSLDDRYNAREGTVLLNGAQALVRLMMEQSDADKKAGLNTAGFVSGYRGSPLGGVDQTFWSAADHLETLNIRFEPGLNEDLAATAVWGTQQTELLGGGHYDGVFGLWYGKNPGVDRSSDVFKHGNVNGTSPNGGVLAISGDDPGASSSTIANQCEQSFAAMMMPVLYPADITDILNFGRFGFEMSRYSGLWVAIKTVADTVESTATVDLDALTKQFNAPANPIEPAQITARWPDDRWSQDKRLQEMKLPAAMDFAATNNIDRIVLGLNNPKRRFGIVTAGKTSLDVLEALALLGIDEAVANEIGLSVYKVGMIWPLEPKGMAEFASGIESLFVIEERRAFLEAQIMELAYHWKETFRPDIYGKTEPTGRSLFSSLGETSPSGIAAILGKQLADACEHPEIRKNLDEILIRKNAPAGLDSANPTPFRIPHFCAGCPHSRSTTLPKGSTAMAGIGCHSLAMWMGGRDTRLLTQMGGEGANWIGASAFVDMPHIFQNMGDGTYNHSGSLAIRAAVAANTTITYKILFNAAVAMTGGQPAEGTPNVGDIARQILAERVEKLVVVSVNPTEFGQNDLPPGTKLVHRNQLEQVMEDCRTTKGVSVIIYDQVCATEKRRRIRSGKQPTLEERIYINHRVCEGCGDCSLKSGCVAIESIRTPFGTKRRINQSVCNLDMSCLDGFCPAIVTVKGTPKKPDLLANDWDNPLPEPAVRAIKGSRNILLAGVGGTGLITVGAILGMAAHLEGKHCSVLDNTGLARKGGAVTTHLRISKTRQLMAARIDVGSSDLLLAGDPIVAASQEVLSRLSKVKSHAVVNSHIIPTAMQALDPDIANDPHQIRALLGKTTGEENITSIDSSALARSFVGNEIFANMVLLGAAFQKGEIPLQVASIKEAITLNGIAVDENQRAFELGRRSIVDPGIITAGGNEENDPDFETLIEVFADDLGKSRTNKVADRYRISVSDILNCELSAPGSEGSVSLAIAQNLYKLLASKDEFEVARLMTDSEFTGSINRDFAGPKTVTYHFASPVLGVSSNATDRGAKKSLGPWFGRPLSLLARMKGIRNSFIDPFRFQSERKLERRLAADYKSDIKRIQHLLKTGKTDKALALARWPDEIRGFGAIKSERAEKALNLRHSLIKSL